MTQNVAVAVTIGRSRKFDRDATLQAAMFVFSRMGYLATCMNDLCKATGVRFASLYVEFGSKKKVYVEAIDPCSSIAD